jgi:hypothetical protein
MKKLFTPRLNNIFMIIGFGYQVKNTAHKNAWLFTARLIIISKKGNTHTTNSHRRRESMPNWI